MWRSNVPKRLPLRFFPRSVSVSGYCTASIPAEEKESDSTTTCFKTGFGIIITISSCDAFYCSAMCKCDLEANSFCIANTYASMFEHEQDRGQGWIWIYTSKFDGSSSPT